MSGLVRALRLALRSLWSQRLVTFASFATLTLGIWATTTTFSFTYTSAVRGLPYEDADEIVYVERLVTAANSDRRVSVHDYDDWSRRQRSFAALAAFRFTSANLADDVDRAERFSAALLTPSTLPLLRVEPALGRGFADGDVEVGADPVVLIGHALWRDRYGADPAVLGRTIRVNGVERTVVGVMPERFAFPLGESVWLPLRVDPLESPRGRGAKLEVVGRLAEGVDIARAHADLASIDRDLAAEQPDTNAELGTRVLPYNTAFLGERVAVFQWTMVAAVFLALVIACINVANLLLARGASRTRDLVVRRALGATRGRVVAQLLLETLLIAGAGGVVGVVAAQATLRRMDAYVRSFVEGFYWIHLEVEWRGLLVTAGLVLFATLVAGLLPALQATAGDMASVLRDDARGSSGRRFGRLVRGLVTAEIALGVALLSGAGVMVKSLHHLRVADFGFEPEALVSARVALSDSYDTPARRAEFWREALRRVREAAPGGGVALANALPASPAPPARIAVEGEAYPDERARPVARRLVVSESYFETLGVPPREGRTFLTQDELGADPVAIVNESFAARHWPGRSALGRRLRSEEGEDAETWRTVVGVVPDLFVGGVRNEEPWGFYVPLAQSDQHAVYALVSARAGTRASGSVLREEVAALDPDLPVFDLRPLDEAITRSSFFFRFLPRIFVALGLVAFAMAAIGLYGVTAFGVSRRRGEIGIRMALGADGKGVVGEVVRAGAVQMGLGALAGLGLAWVLNAGLSLWMVGVEPRDPAVLTATAVAMAVTGLLATWLPARAAAAVDPVQALR